MLIKNLNRVSDSMTRIAKVSRKTSETDINIELDIDGTGKYEIDTGVNFFNHMLESFSKHSMVDLEIQATGDIEIDDHHTIEDVGILLGEAFSEAIGDKKGIKRMAHAIVPMDESVATVAIDGAVNAALLAIEMLAITDDGLAAKLKARRDADTAKVLEKNAAAEAEFNK